MDSLPLEARKADNFRKATREGGDRGVQYYFKKGFQCNLVSYLQNWWLSTKMLSV